MRLIGNTRSHVADSREIAALPDDVLVRRAQQDPELFGVLWQRYAMDIQRFHASRLGGDRTTAEDLTSITFSKALAALPRFTDGPFRAWLYQIARNALIDHQRRQRPVAPPDALDAMPSDHLSPHEQAVRAEAADRLYRAMRKLKGNQHEIVKLRLLGCDTDEICERLGLSPNAVKSAQFRAFSKLRESLGDVL